MEYFFYEDQKLNLTLVPENEAGSLYRFRSHHIPTHAYGEYQSYLSTERYRTLSMSCITEGLEEPYKSRIDVMFENTLWSYRRARVNHFAYDVKHRTKGISDYININIDNNTDEQVQRFADVETDDLKFLLTGEAYTKVAVGGLKDNVCRTCYIGEHCTRVSRVNNLDDLIANHLVESQLLLGREVRVMKSPEVLSQAPPDSDSDLITKPSPIAVVSLGDLREFLMRRALQSEIIDSKKPINSLNTPIWQLPAPEHTSEVFFQVQIELAKQSLKAA